MLPLVSVIIPVYNRPQFLLEAVDSVFKQDYSSLELIVGDDGSVDDTLACLEAFLEKNPSNVSVRILKLDHSGFPGLVRNRCAAKAQGKYLAFLDSDDLWLPNKISNQMTVFLAANNSFKFSHTNEEWNRSGKVISQAFRKHKKRGDIFEDALNKCIIGPSTFMIESAYFNETGGFREDMEIAEDYEYWLRLTSCEEVAFIEDFLTVKRAGHSDLLSEKYDHIEIFRIEGLKALVDQKFFNKEKMAIALRELVRKCTIYARGCEKRNKMKEAQSYFQLAEKYKCSSE